MKAHIARLAWFDAHAITKPPENSLLKYVIESCLCFAQTTSTPSRDELPSTTFVRFPNDHRWTASRSNHCWAENPNPTALTLSRNTHVMQRFLARSQGTHRQLRELETWSWPGARRRTATAKSKSMPQSAAKPSTREWQGRLLAGEEACPKRASKVEWSRGTREREKRVGWKFALNKERFGSWKSRNEFYWQSSSRRWTVNMWARQTCWFERLHDFNLHNIIDKNHIKYCFKITEISMKTVILSVIDFLNIFLNFV